VGIGVGIFRGGYWWCSGYRRWGRGGGCGRLGYGFAGGVVVVGGYCGGVGIGGLFGRYLGVLGLVGVRWLFGDFFPVKSGVFCPRPPPPRPPRLALNPGPPARPYRETTYRDRHCRQNLAAAPAWIWRVFSGSLFSFRTLSPTAPVGRTFAVTTCAGPRETVTVCRPRRPRFCLSP
jgi:hypothetical protein